MADSERSQRPKKKKKKPEGMSAGLLWGLIGGGAGLLIVIVVLILWAAGVFDSKGSTRKGDGVANLDKKRDRDAPAIDRKPPTDFVPKGTDVVAKTDAGPKTVVNPVGGDWKEVRSAVGKYTIRLPGTVLAGTNPVDKTRTEASAFANDQHIIVRSHQFSGPEKERTPQQILDSNTALGFRKQTPLTLRGFMGAEVVDENGKEIVRVYVGNGTVYEISVAGFGGMPANRAFADQIFNSFQILD